MEISKNFDSKTLESKWYSFWMENNYFSSVPNNKTPYTIVIPPPNVTGILHMGHMLNNTMLIWINLNFQLFKHEQFTLSKSLYPSAGSNFPPRQSLLSFIQGEAVSTSCMEYHDLIIPLVTVLTPKYLTALFSLFCSELLQSLNSSFQLACG